MMDFTKIKDKKAAGKCFDYAILPKETKQMYELVMAGDLPAANKLQDAMLPVIDQLFTEVNPIPAKAAANMIGLDAGLPRGPLTELEPAHKESLRAALRTFGLNV